MNVGYTRNCATVFLNVGHNPLRTVIPLHRLFLGRRATAVPKDPSLKWVWFPASATFDQLVSTRVHGRRCGGAGVFPLLNWTDDPGVGHFRWTGNLPTNTDCVANEWRIASIREPVHLISRGRWPLSKEPCVAIPLAILTPSGQNIQPTPKLP